MGRKRTSGHRSSLAPSALNDIPAENRKAFSELVALTDAFCEAHLNEEYKEVCRLLAAALCQDGSPVHRGKLSGWAAGVVYAVGWVNFITDPSQTPHYKSGDIARLAGVSSATMHNRFREIRDGLDLLRLDPDFTLPSRLDHNPLVWMVEIDGVPVDVRILPREIQEKICEAGLIPYVPDDVDEPE